MPSVKNPNTPNKSRRIASRSKVQKARSQSGKTKNPRGTAPSAVLYPTSGPAAPLSGKKARKVEKARAHARKRALEQMVEDGTLDVEGDGEMTDVPATKKKAAKNEKLEKAKATEDETMDVDAIA